MVTSRASEFFLNMDVTKKENLGITEKAATPANSITRREAARRLLGAVSAGALLQFGATDHPIWKHLSDEALLDRVEAVEAASSPRFLNSQQYSNLVAIAEAIVPGSTKANVAEFVDLLLSVDAHKNQRDFLQSLEQIDSESQKKFAKSFVALSEAQKSELLSASVGMSGETKPEAAFENLKTWIRGAYYSSEMGMKELGWTPNRFFPQFPGCTHSEEHVSNQSRQGEMQ